MLDLDSNYGLSDESTGLKLQPASRLIKKAKRRLPDEKKTTLPNSEEEFRQRLSTFKFCLWSSVEISPLICSSYGWHLKEKDLLQCVTCEALLCATLPSPSEHEAYRKFLDILKNRLETGHKNWCGWPENCCSAKFLHPPLYVNLNYLQNLHDEALKMVSLGGNLPYVNTKEFLDKLELGEEQISLFYREQNTPTKTQLTAAILVLFGWMYESSNKIRCTLCLRSIGLWSFLSLDKEDKFFELRERDLKKREMKKLKEQKREKREMRRREKEEILKAESESQKKTAEAEQQKREDAERVKDAMEKLSRFENMSASESDQFEGVEGREVEEEEENSLLADVDQECGFESEEEIEEGGDIEEMEDEDGEEAQRSSSIDASDNQSMEEQNESSKSGDEEVHSSGDDKEHYSSDGSLDSNKVEGEKNTSDMSENNYEYDADTTDPETIKNHSESEIEEEEEREEGEEAEARMSSFSEEENENEENFERTLSSENEEHGSELQSLSSKEGTENEADECPGSAEREENSEEDEQEQNSEKDKDKDNDNGLWLEAVGDFKDKPNKERTSMSDDNEARTSPSVALRDHSSGQSSPVAEREENSEEDEQEQNSDKDNENDLWLEAVGKFKDKENKEGTSMSEDNEARTSPSVELRDHSSGQSSPAGGKRRRTTSSERDDDSLYGDLGDDEAEAEMDMPRKMPKLDFEDEERERSPQNTEEEEEEKGEEKENEANGVNNSEEEGSRKTSDGEISSESEDEGLDEEDILYNQMKGSLFCPLDQHRHWCGWVVECSSLHLGGSNDQPFPGFKILPPQLKRVLPQYFGSSLATSEKYGRNVEGLRAVRSILDSWSALGQIEEETED